MAHEITATASCGLIMMVTGMDMAGQGNMGAEALGALYDLRWMLVLVAALILADFWFGVSDSLKQDKPFRFSRAGRRTCNKAVDYLTYLLLGSLLGLGVLEPLGWATHTQTAAVGIGLGMVWEIDSIIGHVCSIHGVRHPFSIKRFLIALIKRKSPDVGTVLEETMEDCAAETEKEGKDEGK